MIPLLSLPMVTDAPVKLILLHDVGQPCLVGEEESEVGGEDGLLHHVQRLLVLLRVEAVEDAVSLLLEDANPHTVQVYCNWLLDRKLVFT